MNCNRVVVLQEPPRGETLSAGSVMEFGSRVRNFIFYHKNCPDGIGSAFVYYHSKIKSSTIVVFTGFEDNSQFDIFSYTGISKDFQFIGINPSQQGLFQLGVERSRLGNFDEETFRDSNVVFLDVLANEPEMKRILNLARKVLVLDHHGDDNKETPNSNYLICQRLGEEYKNFESVHSFTFSRGDKQKEKCGMELANDYFNEGKSEFQWLINVISDRDKWTWKHPNSKELGEYLYVIGLFDVRETNGFEELLPRNHPFEIWDKIISNACCVSDCLSYGRLLIRRKNIDIQLAVKYADKCILKTPSGVIYHVYFSCCDHNIASDVGNILATKGKEEGIDFAVCYRYNFRSNEWWLSLRSVGEFNTRLVAQEFGGEGHKNASGCTIKGSDGLHKYFVIQ
jgi:hypothetical protein